MWALRCLGEKNTLTAADAKKVEEAFQAKLATLVAHEPASAPADSERPDVLATSCLEDTDNRPRSKTVNKSVLALPEPRRIRDRDHVKSVAETPVSFAVDSLQTPTTSDSRKTAHWGARSAMSSPCLCAEAIIARSTAPAMKSHGGAKLVSIRALRLGRFGLRHIRKPASFFTAHQITKRLAPAASTVFKIWARIP